MYLVPGKNVGIIAAQSIASSLTQSVLNQFHSCGSNIKMSTKGVQRLSSLLNLTQKTPSTIYRLSFNSNDQYKRSDFEYKIFKDFVIDYFLTDRPEWVTWYIDNADTSGILIKLDYKKMYSFKCQLPSLPYSHYVTNPFFEIYIWGDSQEELEQVYLPQIFEIYMCGIKYINCMYETRENILAVAVYNQYLFRTILTMPSIDPNKTVSSNPWDIYFQFGIEAARMYLFSECREIMDKKLNPLHIELLVNQITWTGILQSVTRFSLREDNSAIFTKASFEESMLNFLNAAYNEDEDTLVEMSSTIVTGQRTKVGSGFFDLIMQ